MIVRSSSPIVDFLQQSLVGGAVGVPELEVKARAAGLLGERQQIQHAKAFKKGKKALGIQSIRNGFGSGGKWKWLMPPQAASEIGSVANSDLATNVQRPVRDSELPDKSFASQFGSGHQRTTSCSRLGAAGQIVRCIGESFRCSAVA